MTKQRIISKKNGFFLYKTKQQKYFPSFVDKANFRKNGKNANWIDTHKTADWEQIKYIVSENYILLDCDTNNAVKTVEEILIKLKLNTYSYETSKEHKHFWFKVDDNVRKMIDLFKLNSFNHNLYIDGIDTRAFRMDGKQAKTGGVFIYDINKDNSTRPSASDLIGNLHYNTCICPLMLLIPNTNWFNKRNKYPIKYDKIVNSGESETQTRHEQELIYATNFKKIGLDAKVCHQWFKEVIELNGNIGREAPELSYINELYRQKEPAFLKDKDYNYHIETDENDFPINMDKAFKIFKEKVKHLKNDLNLWFKFSYFNNEIWIQDNHNNERINFSNYHTDKTETMKFLKIECEKYLKRFDNLKVKTKNGILDAKKTAIKEIGIDLKLLKNRIVKLDDTVVCQNYYINKNGVFENKGINEPFTLNKINRDYIDDVKCPKVLEKYLYNLFGTKERIDIALKLLSFTIANTPSPSALCITGPSNCGKSTLEKLINGVIGINNAASIDGDKVCSGANFGLEGIVNKTWAVLNENGGVVVSKVNNIFKKLLDTTDYLNGVNEKYVRTRRVKSTTSFMFLSNETLEFDITDPALINRFSFLLVSDYYKPENKLTNDEYGELLNNKDTYDWLFKVFFQHQIKLLGKYKHRNVGYHFNQSEYIQDIENANKVISYFKKNDVNKLPFEEINRRVRDYLLSKKDVPTQKLKRYLDYCGYRYDKHNDYWVKGDD